MIKIGCINELIVQEKGNDGYCLVDNLSDDEAFLPHANCEEDLSTEQRIEVFVFLDNDNKIIASMKRPIAIVGEFGLMRAVESIQIGAFFDWGISKNLFVPDTEQRQNIYPGDIEILRVCLDQRTEKVFGTTKIGKYINASEFKKHDLKEGDKVSITPVRKEELGYRCLINKNFIGMIYQNEIFKHIKIGAPLEGFVKKLRDDGLVDAALQVQGFKNLIDSKDKIMAYLRENGGRSHLHDKSSPQDIRDILGMSKQTFKNTIGMLYRDRKIVITKTGIHLPQKS
tara:strand:+ start:106 stop:957 length:852 start_codon:yes stop_codon:yes gene_type:complete